MKTLIIIPAYNEEENIEGVVQTLREHCPACDYLIVNDCSKDRTGRICDEKGLHHLDLCSNLGIGGGVQSGYLYAFRNGYDCAVQFDGDGQHDAAYIGTLIAPIEDGTADMVIGSRFVQKQGFQSSTMRRAGIRWLSFLIRLSCGARVRDVTSGFRAVNKKMIEVFSEDYAEDYPEPEAIVSVKLRGGIIREVPVLMHERQGGNSSITLWKSVYYMIKVSLTVIFYRLIFKGGNKK